MKIVIIGSGLIGATTAYVLSLRGHEVTVLDREGGPGLGASFANGALLTPSMADPWNSPGTWKVLLASVGRSGAPLQLRLRALPSLVGWGITFLRNSRATRFEQNRLMNLRLAVYSLRVMESYRIETGIEYDRRARGSLRIFRSGASFDQASESAARLASEGLSFQSLTPEEVVSLEPGLEPLQGNLAGGLYNALDETGDAYRFCVALVEVCRRQGVQFCFESEISSIDVRSGYVSSIQCGGERWVADRYIVAAGSYSTELLRSVGIRLPVRPAKGYSVTFRNDEHEPSLKIPVIDDQLHAVVVPLHGALRVAGTAEFTGYDIQPNPAPARNLLEQLLNAILPCGGFGDKKGTPWCGLRAMSADGVPLIGFTPIHNLMVNTGHGHLGWTMAAASAQLTADLLDGNASAIDPAPYDPKRFAPTLNAEGR